MRRSPMWPSRSRSVPPARFASPPTPSAIASKAVSSPSTATSSPTSTSRPCCGPTRERGASGTIGLHPVEDSSAYGLVRCEEGGRVLEFLEKTGEAVPGEINAGAYVLERSVLDLIPPGQAVSIEREVFPRLIGAGLSALLLDGYWMDIGTPERYLQASWDILEGAVETRVKPTAPGLLVGAGAEIDAGAEVGPRAVVARRLPGRARGPGCRFGPSRRLRRRPRCAGPRLDPRPGRKSRTGRPPR